MTETLIAPPGLRNVVVADTALGEVRGEQGFFHYREHDATRLAVERSFEECWHLLFDGRLPSADELAAFVEEVGAARELPPELEQLLPAVAGSGEGRDLMPRLRTVLSQLGAVEGFAPVWGSTPQRVRAEALRVAAVTPTLLASLHRLRRGLEPIAPDPSLSTGANWVRMVTGSTPGAAVERAVSTYLGLTLDHGFNASTFTARVIASAGADVVAAVCGAIGTFTGPLHGGAPDRALDALDEIGSPERAPAWVRQKVAAGERVMGFGHGVYTTEDPRARVLRGIAAELGGELYELAAGVETGVLTTLAELKPGRRLDVNVEYWAGVVMEQCGIPRSMFTPTFTCARVVGWGAHVMEQAGGGRIFRPLARYTGPEPTREGTPGPR
ncbi:citrate synthase/methylcitrate synthase [Auraticoccus sp. F435]|uniref:Citrate synthase n=1 Tax=Auraticoccus cholistanensis TaxID=2656650 RepID=A0A6A9UTK9_9ACTN|nr:citrate/2-methylcitrate synthase [Auraticoccus cholistanensis]MVA75075.1 citrate synthase/methylcitrate synthase [Auraticoccus cholistanensis]